MSDVLYTSEPMTIGKHEWRLVIFLNWRDQPVTDYQFQRDGVWTRGRDWPGYDINDTYLGLPVTLHKLWDREHEALAEFGLRPKPEPSTQIEMFA